MAGFRDPLFEKKNSSRIQPSLMETMYKWCWKNVKKKLNFDAYIKQSKQKSKLMFSFQSYSIRANSSVARRSKRVKMCNSMRLDGQCVWFTKFSGAMRLLLRVCEERDKMSQKDFAVISCQ
jgi:hypothetical protein